MRKVFKINRMTCVNCQRTIQIGLKKTKGVEDVDVSLVLERAIVRDLSIILCLITKSPVEYLQNFI